MISFSIEWSKERRRETVGQDILIDGYNVIKCAPSFQAARVQNMAAARAQLISLLVNRYRHTPHQVTVVFDGDAQVEQVSNDQRIRVIYSCHGETADSVITRLAVRARAAGRDLIIYSDDIEVQQAGTEQQGTIQTSNQLERQMYRAPRDVERRARHRIAMKRKYGLDPSAKEDDSDDLPSTSPGKKKKKRR